MDRYIVDVNKLNVIVDINNQTLNMHLPPVQDHRDYPFHPFDLFVPEKRMYFYDDEKLHN